MLIYIQIFNLVKATIFFKRIQQPRLIIKNNEQTKQDRYFDETNKSRLWIGIKLKKIMCERLH